MRIEKINDHQIRCTLNQKDLSDRELRVSELAYGSEKARSLFQDMMQQASYEFGFEADDIPLMIEAIPMSPDTLVLVITKVDDPDELDTRFSHFTDDENEDDMDSFDDNAFRVAEDEDEDNFGFMSNTILSEPEEDTEEDVTFSPDEPPSKGSDFISLSEALGMEHRPKTVTSTAQRDATRIFTFHSLQEITSLAEYLVYTYHGKNTLYKDEKKGIYYLVVHKSEHTPEEFSRICNMICEYGKPLRNMYATHFYFEEHYEPLIRDKALQVLASI